MTKDYAHRPFAMPVVKHYLNTSISGSQMVTRVPWQAPVNKAYVIRKIVATTANPQSGGVINIWDQDLSNTSPVGRGSGTSPLIVVPVGAGTSGGVSAPATTLLFQDALPQEFFQAGVTMSSTPAVISGISISFEFEAV